MKISRVTGDDGLLEATSLLQRFFLEEGFDTPPATIARRAAQMAGLDSCVLLLAKKSGVAVGVATLSMEFGIEFGWWAELGDLYVLPNFRGLGVATALIAASEEYARTKGATGYQVTVTPVGEEHMGLKAYYTKLGFDGDGRVLLFKYF